MSPVEPPPCERLLGGAAIESPDDPAGGATYPWDTAATGDDRATCLKLTFVLSGLADVLATARETGLHVRGSAGAGVAYAALDAGASVESAQDAVRRIRETCTRAGGSAVVVDAPAAVKAAVDVWGPVPALDLMRRVKDQFDPDHRLVAGPIRGRRYERPGRDRQHRRPGDTRRRAAPSTSTTRPTRR